MLYERIEVKGHYQLTGRVMYMKHQPYSLYSLYSPPSAEAEAHTTGNDC